MRTHQAGRLEFEAGKENRRTFGKDVAAVGRVGVSSISRGRLREGEGG